MKKLVRNHLEFKSFIEVFLSQNGYILTDEYEISIDHLEQQENDGLSNESLHNVKLCSIPKGMFLCSPFCNSNIIKFSFLNLCSLPDCTYIC